MFDTQYETQTRLLLSLLPLLERHACFALKGGTAINLFVRDLPRVSVDIDLAYVPLKPREEALTEISEHLRELAGSAIGRTPGAQVREHRSDRRVDRVAIETPEAAIKIEPNTIFRGCVYPAEIRKLTPSAQEQFGLYVRVRTLSVADLYGGKLCAALDRQHPRDLFDVKVLMETDGITPEIRRAFVVYLAGHNRPMSELLAPRSKDISALFHSHFRGMTREDVSLDSLVAVQQELPEKLVSSLDEDERTFLLALKKGQPEWDQLGFEDLALLPALQWKLKNIRRMDPEKHCAALEILARILSA